MTCERLFTVLGVYLCTCRGRLRAVRSSVNVRVLYYSADVISLIFVLFFTYEFPFFLYHHLQCSLFSVKINSITRKSSCGKPQEAYRLRCNLSNHILSQGGTYLGHGGVPTLAGGYLPWTGGTYLGVPPHPATLDGGVYLPWGTPSPLLTDRHLWKHNLLSYCVRAR